MYTHRRPWWLALLIVSGAALADDPKTADEVITRHVAALGGREKLAARRSLRLTSKISMPNDMAGQLITEWKRPDRFRSELKVAGGGATMVQAFDGNTWRQIMGIFGNPEPEEMLPEEARIYAEQADVDGPLVDYAKKEHRIELVGREEIDGQAAYKLHVVLKSAREGEADDYFIDAKSWMVVQVKGRRKVLNLDVKYQRIFSDYKPVDGVPVAHRRREQNDDSDEKAAYTTIVEKAEANVDLPDERFALVGAIPKPTSSQPATTQPTSAPAPVKNEPAAHALYDRMIAALRAAESLTFESKYELGIGELPPTACSYKAWLKKPNYFRLESFDRRGKAAGVLIGDGEQLWLYWPQGRPRFSTAGGTEDAAKYNATREKVYMTKPAPQARHSIGHEVGMLGSGMIMNILDLSTFHGYTDGLQPLLDGVAGRGTETFADELCDVVELSYMDGQRAWRVWISQRDHLPRKLAETVHVATEIHAQEIWTDIRVNEDIKPERFIWNPPEDWQVWKMPETEQALLKVGTAAPDFELALADGKLTRLSDYRGKMVWLVYWRAG